MRTKQLQQDDCNDIVTLEEAMEHSRITDNYDEIVVQGCLDAAHDSVQQWLNRKLVPTLMVGQVEEFRPKISLAFPPITEFKGITAETIDGDTVTLSPGIDYKFDSISECIRFKGDNVNRYKMFEFEYVCGYPDGTVPKAVKHAILMMFATLYENREDIVVGTSVMPVPTSSQRLLRSHRVRSST